MVLVEFLTLVSLFFPKIKNVHHILTRIVYPQATHKPWNVLFNKIHKLSKTSRVNLFIVIISLFQNNKISFWYNFLKILVFT